MRLEFAIERAAWREAVVEALEKAEDGGGEYLRKSDAGELLEAELASVLRRQRIDVLLGNEDDDLVPALEQHLAHREGGKQMASGSASGDDKPQTALLSKSPEPPPALEAGLSRSHRRKSESQLIRPDRMRRVSCLRNP